MPSLQDMALVDLGDGKGPRHIPGVSWSPRSGLYEAHMTDPQGRRLYLGGFEEPRRAAEAINSMASIHAKLGEMKQTMVGGPKPGALPPAD